MRLSIPYGKDQIHFQVPEENLIGIFPPRSAQGTRDESKAVREALLNPIESKPLSDLAKGKNTAVIMATDISRPTKDNLILPVILDTLVEAGIKEEKITVIIARGQHRKMRALELLKNRFNSGVKYSGKTWKWDTVILNKTQELARFLLDKSRQMGFIEPRPSLQRCDTLDLRKRILELTQGQAHNLSIERSTLHYLRRRAKSGHSFRVYATIHNKLRQDFDRSGSTTVPNER